MKRIFVLPSLLAVALFANASMAVAQASAPDPNPGPGQVYTNIVGGTPEVRTGSTPTTAAVPAKPKGPTVHYQYRNGRTTVDVGFQVINNMPAAQNGPPPPDTSHDAELKLAEANARIAEANARGAEAESKARIAEANKHDDPQPLPSPPPNAGTNDSTSDQPVVACACGKKPKPPGMADWKKEFPAPTSFADLQLLRQANSLHSLVIVGAIGDVFQGVSAGAQLATAVRGMNISQSQSQAQSQSQVSLGGDSVAGFGVIK